MSSEVVRIKSGELVGLRSPAYCTKCGGGKTCADFMPSQLQMRKQGLRGICRECHREYYLSMRAERLAYQRRRQVTHREHIREYQRHYYQTKEDKMQRVRQQRESRQRHPERYMARTAVGNAIRDGRLTKPDTCCISNDRCSGQIEAHHTDYSKPLDVMWLCSTHHGAWHKVFEAEVSHAT